MEHSIEIKKQVKKARTKFVAMASTYFLGVFNDNFFKQAAMLIAVTVGKSELQGTATQLFSIPFILFSAYAGWFSDRYAKRKVVIGSKILEMVAMCAGAYGLLTENWFFILAMVFTMALQSTIFSPALNGSIPELYPEEYVTKANAFLKLVTTVAILIGIALAGVALDMKSLFNSEYDSGRILVAIIILLIAGIGLAASFFCHKYEGIKSKAKFPLLGPIASIKDIIKVRKDKALFEALIGSSFFYMISSLAVLIINKYGISQLGYSQTTTSLLTVSLMIGICVGSFIVAKISNNKTWVKMPAPSTLGIGIGFLLTGLVPFLPSSFGLISIFITLTITGCFAGMLLIPIASFIQVRPKADEKGKMLAAGNFLDFIGIYISGVLFSMLDKFLNPSTSLLLLGGVSILVAIYFKKSLKNIKL